MKNLNVRLDDSLHARIKEAAAAESRSLNRQIAWLLELGLDSHDNPANFEARRRRIIEASYDDHDD